jgi:hypothetical protein
MSLRGEEKPSGLLNNYMKLSMCLSIEGLMKMMEAEVMLVHSFLLPCYVCYSLILRGVISVPLAWGSFPAAAARSQGP